MDGWTILPRQRRDRLGEGITWLADEGSLCWVDILGHRIHRHNLATGEQTEWTTPEMIGWIIPRAGRAGFVAGMASGFHALTLEPYSLAPMASPAIMPGDRMNDACADDLGRIWAGTMNMAETRDSGALYRLDPDLSWHEVDRPYTIANGPAISSDGTALFHADSPRRVVWRLAVNDDGSLGPRTPFIRFADEWGYPDGMAMDAEGGLWIAHWGGGCVSRFAPDGRRERSIALPASQITRPCFAGPALDRMFLTSAANGVDEPLAGSVFEIDPGVRGLAPAQFGG